MPRSLNYFKVTVMRARKLAIAALTLGFVGLASQGFAQGPPEKFQQCSVPPQKKSFSLVRELDELGQNLFGDIIPSKDKPRKTRQPVPRQSKPTRRNGLRPP